MKRRTTRKRTVRMQLIEEAQELNRADRTLTNTSLIDRFQGFDYDKIAEVRDRAKAEAEAKWHKLTDTQ